MSQLTAKGVFPPIVLGIKKNENKEKEFD